MVNQESPAGHGAGIEVQRLEGISEGMAASYAYMEIIDPATNSERKTQLEKELLEYCHLDTFAMVKVAQRLANAK